MGLDNAFFIIVMLTIIQRIAELFLAKSNEVYIKKIGGYILAERNYFFMVVLHSAWLIVLLYNAYMKRGDYSSVTIFYSFLGLFLFGQALRWLAISTLGRRWSTRIMILPNAPVIKKNIFNYIRHPNYLGVALEIFALPAMVMLWQEAIIFSVINAIILFYRIRFEEKCLSEYNNYQKVFYHK